MAGRRIAHRVRRHNPLYYLFMLLLTLVAVLLIAVAVLGVQVHTLRAQLAQYPSAQAEPSAQEESAAQEEASQEPEQTERALPTIDKGIVDRSEEAAQERTQENTQTEEPQKTALGKVGWLDLTGHDELEVAPAEVWNDYSTRYVSDCVNLRSGPDTGYAKLDTLDIGTEVAAVAEQGAWSFVGVGAKFGWVKTEYLLTELPETAQTLPEREDGTDTEPDAEAETNTDTQTDTETDTEAGDTAAVPEGTAPNTD